MAPPVWDKLKEVLTNPAVIMKKLKEYADQKNAHPATQTQIDSVEGAINALVREKNRWSVLYVKGHVSEESCDKEIKKCDEQIEGLRTQKIKLSQLIVSEGEEQRRISSIENLYTKLKDSLENATYEIRWQILQKLVGRITKKDDLLEIEFNIPLGGQFPCVDCSNNRRMDRTI